MLLGRKMLGRMGCRGLHMWPPHSHGHPPFVTLWLPPPQCPSPRVSRSLSCAVNAGRGVRGSQGIDPVPGPGPHRCPHPRVNTRPRGPQEMAVLCHGRWLLLTPGHRRLRGHPGCRGQASLTSLARFDSVPMPVNYESR